jgi:hypothetical protein
VLVLVVAACSSTPETAKPHESSPGVTTPSNAPLVTGPAPTPGTQPETGGSPATAGHELYGYLPYWEMSSSMADYLQGVPLTSLQPFSVTANRNGTIDRGQLGYKRITGAIGGRIISEAHARGQRVELVFSSFGFDRNAALFGVSTLPSVQVGVHEPLDTPGPAGDGLETARTVRGLLALVRQLHVDGISVDVEQIGPASYDGFSSFITELRQGLDGIGSELRLSASTIASQRGANLASTAVDAGADRIFLMGYDFHWAGSDPGGTSPIDRLDGGASLTSAMATYAAAGVPANRILLGLPLYGIAWPVASTDRYAPQIGSGTVWLPSKHVAELTAPGFVPHPDPLEVTEYLSEVTPPAAGNALATPTYRAVFYDSPRTLRAKLGLALTAGYAGSGFWAIGYEKGVPGYTGLMADFLAGRVDPAPPTDAVDPATKVLPCIGPC